MQANFSALYHGCSLKTILNFYIFNTKISQLQISLQSSRTTKGPCRQLPTGALAYSIYSASQADICFYITPLK